MWRGAEGEGEMTARRIAGYRIGLKKGNNERGGNGQNAPLAARLGIPHWMMMAGAILVALGVIGLAFNRNRNEGQSVSPLRTPETEAKGTPRFQN